MSFVYVVSGWKGEDWFKIGYTDNLERRFGGQANLVRAIDAPNPAQNESALHRLFANRRQGQGEAFALTAGDLRLLQKLSEISNPWPLIEAMADRETPNNQLTCNRCNGSWIRRVDNPKQCPLCRSPFWNKPRRITSQIKNYPTTPLTRK